MMLPEINGDPCWVFTNGPFNLENRRKIRQKAGHRYFVRIIRPDLFGPLIFEFNADVAQSVEHIVANDKAEGS